MANEILSAEEKKRERIKILKLRKEEKLLVSFRVDKIIGKGFVVRVGELYALVPFYFMPWKYPLALWHVIFPSLVGKYFGGYVHSVNEDMLRVRIRADDFQFEPFLYEIDKTYTAIVLVKTNTSLLVDFGYGLEWKYGSLQFKITCFHKDKSIDWFPYYNQGEEFNAVYLGKSAGGNDIFDYGKGYYSIEHKLIGRNIWVNLEKTTSGSYHFLNRWQNVGELLLDENDNLGLPYELVQKMLQTLPNGQRLWCKVTNVTSDGTLQLKWLIDAVLPIEETLSVHSDASVLNINDALVSENKKALVNKMLWCEPCKAAVPRKFKIDGQYLGTISLDANLYPDISLVQLLDAINKIPENQHVFCKIKGIYPDGTFKLQWIAALTFSTTQISMVAVSAKRFLDKQ